ncbi:MAG TPA: AAA family ATPase [Steroidobacteraceae bacterium]|nr:AAA family ATPase [Steroidobacteraceae bacterium]
MNVDSFRVRIVRVSISQLYGLYDHHIVLNREERVTILHGPNGVGKSMLLRMVAAFFSGRYRDFTLVPFRDFTIALSDGSIVAIHWPDGGIGARQSATICVTISGPDTVRYELPIVSAYEQIATQIERSSANVGRSSDGRFIDFRNGLWLTAEEVVDRFGSAEEASLARFVKSDDEPKEARTLRSRVSVHYVETQRLLRSPDPLPRAEKKPMIATVRSYSDDIVRQISRTLTRYGTESQKLDQTFPQRLIGSQLPTVSPGHLKEKLGALDRRQSDLNSLGLIDKVSYQSLLPFQIDQLDDTKRSVMALYVADTETKLSLLDDLSTRVRLLVQSVNGKFRNKTLGVSRERGLQIFDKYGTLVPLEFLSSGEQHELVLWYDLLFKVESNSLVLIDEPELSLHVTWQKKFLPELMETARTVPFDTIIATHSPFIIGDRLDLTVPLDADVDQ